MGRGKQSPPQLRRGRELEETSYLVRSTSKHKAARVWRLSMAVAARSEEAMVGILQLSKRRIRGFGWNLADLVDGEEIVAAAYLDQSAP